MRALGCIRNAGDWARAVASLPVTGALAERVVLVPRERVAHALRRELARMQRADVLAGTRFVGPLTAAEEVLREAASPLVAGEEGLRPLRLRRLFATADLELEHFELDQLRGPAGWDEAIARTLGELEAAGRSPDDLGGDARSRDLARLWRTVNDAAGPSVTDAGVYAEATRVLEADPTRWPFGGPTLAAVTGLESAVHARFVRAIPNVHLALHRARPPRRIHLDRVHALFGEPAAGLARQAEDPAEHAASPACELNVLRAAWMAPPDRATDPGRPRSDGMDGSVHLEEHAGVDEELEAAADWVAREILEHGTPLEDIALLAPAADPWVGLIAQRLARLPAGDGDLPVHVAGGLPLAHTTGGARVLAVLRALARYLDTEAMAALLPLLKGASEATAPRMSTNDARALAWSLGTAGGSRARPDGALHWVNRARGWCERVRHEEAAARGDATDPGRARDLQVRVRRAEHLETLAPALEALVEVAGKVVDDAPLPALWAALRTLLDAHVRLPGRGAAAPALLAGRIEPLCASPIATELTGEDALAFIERTATELRIPHGRFGEPAVYVGTVAGAAGLPFRAVRLVGLCEGALPSVPQEDPVLPDDARRALGPAVPTSAHRVLAQLHALSRAIAHAGERVVLSAPRLGPERTQREPSSVFLEAGVALGRPARSAAAAHPEGDPVRPKVPDRAVLVRDYLAPARRDLAAYRDAHPLTACQWADRVARGHAPPPSWTARGALDLARIERLERERAPGPLDGLLGDGLPDWLFPGLTPHRAVSASRLDKLLGCPHQYLLEAVLGLSAPDAPPDQRALDVREYGLLLHDVAEAFANAHGDAFGRREGALHEWTEAATQLADRVFDRFLQERPLIGERVRAQERTRLHRDVRWFLEHDWNGGTPRTLVAAERAFGYDAPVPLPLEGGALHVHGRIDRMDRDGDALLLRDLKTGNPHPRNEGNEPDPRTDLQLGVYGLVARALADRWALPPRFRAEYVYVAHPAKPTRAYGDDHDLLETAAQRWLQTALDVLRHRALVRTPDPDDCRYCDHQPVCGPFANARGREVLERRHPSEVEPAFVPLRALKGVGGAE